MTSKRLAVAVQSTRTALPSFQPLLVTIVSGDDGNDCETHYPLCPYGKKCTYGSKCKYFHIERRYQSPLSITESLQMKARLEKSKLQHHLSNPSVAPIAMNNGKRIGRSCLSSCSLSLSRLAFKPAFNQTRSGPEHLRMYSSSMMPEPQPSPSAFYPMLEQSLVDDAHTTYEYGLPPSAAATPSTEFSFVDQQIGRASCRERVCSTV